jgi:hypothetical protein
MAYLGHVISADDVTMDAAKVQAVLDWPRPQSVHAMQGFLGLAGYYMRFIKDYGMLTEPLTQLLHKIGFRWLEEAKTAFRALQRVLMTASILQLLDFNRDFIVE